VRVVAVVSIIMTAAQRGLMVITARRHRRPLDV